MMNVNDRNKVRVTVSGVIASGKSTVAKIVADALDSHGISNTLDDEKTCSHTAKLDHAKKVLCLVEHGAVVNIHTENLKSSSHLPKGLECWVYETAPNTYRTTGPLVIVTEKEVAWACNGNIQVIPVSQLVRVAQ